MIELTKITGDVNPKLFKKFVKYFFQDNRFQSYFFYQENEKHELLLKQLNVFVNDDLSVETLREIYAILPLKHEKDDSEMIRKYIEITTFDKLYEFGFQILKDNYFNYFSIEMFKLFICKWLINHKYLPVVFYPTVSKEIYNQIVNIGDYNQAIQLIEFLYFRSLGQNRKRQAITQEMLVVLLLEHQDQIKTLYEVNHLYIFGSFARKNNTGYSDIDLLVISKNTDDDFYKKLYSYFQTILGFSLDLKIIENTDEFNPTEKISVF